jgi:hypothetical protein
MIRITPNEIAEMIWITPNEILDWSELPQMQFYMIEGGLRVLFSVSQ